MLEGKYADRLGRLGRLGRQHVCGGGVMKRVLAYHA